ncbi:MULTISPECIES: hypothetical protein [unclassified Agarivorans]|uniref:hypothetical protein n=1 Tax=unclassified Agarivorans TaxID=2636026 RepID=UPI0026E132DA|nr:MULTISPECIES: hypothetical protein [unclassified Agarivorans]MDO6686542.1 hypothetical protein [Agarivorans sp. 3_MG-2023]MDO6715360.1 hypothetical protein [Agarivorans sp. 2_MG-2023]
MTLTKGMLKGLSIAALPMLLAACVNMTGKPYTPSTTNVIKMQESIETKLKLDAFTENADIPELVCRLGAPIDVTAGKTRAQYIYEAMQTELFMAGVYDSKSDTVLSGTLTYVSFSSTSPASWTITMDVASSKSEGYTVTTNYPFKTSYDGKQACQNVADAFAPAVQRLIRDVISHPDFSSLAASS